MATSVTYTGDRPASWQTPDDVVDGTEPSSHMLPTTNQISANASNEFRALAARARKRRRPSGSGGGPAVAANRARPALTRVPAVNLRACTMPQARHRPPAARLTLVGVALLIPIAISACGGWKQINQYDGWTLFEMPGDEVEANAFEAAFTAFLAN